jgi:DNA-binding LytR/AlgR family response regulator
MRAFPRLGVRMNGAALSLQNGEWIRRLREPRASRPAGPESTIDYGTPLVLVGEREHRLYLLDPRKIDYIESAGNYVKYRIANNEYIARESVKHLEEVLCTEGFVRIERSLLLNIRGILYAQTIGHGTFVFTLISGARLRSGPAYRDAILKVLPLRRRAPPRGGKRAEPHPAIRRPAPPLSG